jgi:hypothetical protein
MSSQSSSQAVDDLPPEKLVRLEVSKDLNHALVTSFVELADDIRADVRWRRQDPHQVSACTDRELI